MHEPLDKYLAQVEKRLGSMPAERRAEELHELRLHLQMMIEDYIAIGDSEEEAMEAALRQFGSAGKLARGLCWENGAPRVGWRRLLLTGAVVVGVETLAFPLCASLSYFLFDPTLGQADQMPVVFQVLLGLMMVSCITSPGGVAAGWIAEKMAPRRAFPLLVATHVLMAYGIMLPSNAGGPESEFSLAFVPGLLFASLGVCLQRRQTQRHDQSTLIAIDID